MDEHVHPAVPIHQEQCAAGERWKVVPIVEMLEARARAARLWNLVMPRRAGAAPVDDVFVFEGLQLTNLAYAQLARIIGRVAFASEVFNWSAPDTGDMAVLERFGGYGPR